MADYERQPYERKIWYNENDEENKALRIPISSKHLNRIEDGIEEALEIGSNNLRTIIDGLSNTIDNINTSSFMCKRDSSGSIITNSINIFDVETRNFKDEVIIPSSSSITNIHTMDNLSFNFDLVGCQPNIRLSFGNIQIAGNYGDGYGYASYKVCLYIYNENEEKIYLGELNNTNRQINITDEDLIDYIVKKNPTVYFETIAHYSNYTRYERTFTSHITVELNNFNFYKAEREVIPNITL